MENLTTPEGQVVPDSVKCEGRQVAAEAVEELSKDLAGNTLEVGAMYCCCIAPVFDGDHTQYNELVRFVGVIEGRETFADADTWEEATPDFDFLVRQDSPVVDVSTKGWPTVDFAIGSAGKLPRAHVKALVARVFVRCTSEDVDRVVSRVMTVHPEAAAADEPFEYQMRGVGCISGETVLAPEFANASDRTVGNVRTLLSQALAADKILSWPAGTAAAMMIGEAALIEYAFDCTLSAAIRVKAKSRQEAESMLRDVLDAADCNGGAWPNGDAVHFEASLDDRKPRLYEVNGDSVDDTGKPLS